MSERSWSFGVGKAEEDEDEDRGEGEERVRREIVDSEAIVIGTELVPRRVGT